MNVDEFIATHPDSQSGRKQCRTCQHSQRAKIDADLRRFNDRRGGTAKDDKGKLLPKAATPWSLFVTEHLAKTYGYMYDYRAAVRHLEKCLGEKVN